MTTTTARRAATARTPPKKSATPARPTQRRAGTGKSAPPKTVPATESSQRKTTTQVAEQAGPRKPVGHALLAAERAVQRDSLHLQLPVVGGVRLLPPEQIAFLGGVTALAIIGLLEWPVAVLLGVGHGLAMRQHNKVMHAFGEALAEA